MNLFETLDFNRFFLFYLFIPAAEIETPITWLHDAYPTLVINKRKN
jgi:hypothetical protein